MSRSTRSTVRVFSVSSAWRPFSANVTVCPSCSSARPRSNRFTRLSSTTSRSPACGLYGEGTPDLHELARGGGERARAERLAVRFERVSHPAERVDVRLGERVSQATHQLATVLDEGVDQLTDERAAHRGRQLL